MEGPEKRAEEADFNIEDGQATRRMK